MINNNTFWYVAGIGAIGSIIAANLCRGLQPVKLLLKNEEQLEIYRKSQLSITTDSFSYEDHPLACLASTVSQPIRYLICCTKAYDVLPFLKSVSSFLSKKSIIILIHNGIGVIEEVNAEFPYLRIISGITSIGGYLEKPYSVRAFLNSPLYLGETIGHYSSEEISYIKNAFNNSFLELEWTNCIDTLIWNKFAVNCSINILTALFLCKNGLLLQHSELLTQLTQEISIVLQALKVNISSGDLLKNVINAIQNTADNYSSMYKDVMRGRSTEIHYLNCRLIELAQEKNLPTSVNCSLVEQFYNLFPNERLDINANG